MRLVPVNFGFADGPILESHLSDTFQFAPPSSTKLSTQAHDVSDSATLGNDLDVLDLADDLEVHT